MSQWDQRERSPLLSDPGVRARLIAWALAAVIFVSGAVYGTALLLSRLGPSGAATTPPAPVDEALKSLVIPEFTLIDQDGRRLGRDWLRGRVTVLAFSFTNCPTACPVMHAHLIRMQGLLTGSTVRIGTISVDPENDTPEALRAYAASKGIDTARWTMLTGDRAEVTNILAGLRVATTEDPSITITLKDGRTMANILHSTRLFVIGPDASVVALEDGLTWAGAESAARKARAAQGLIGGGR
ncbi:MAG TPA: hypothetical protein DEB06_00310 [Phycisphaerales bacterium]|nr:hypothetical protein [Phycisphaerales bacterium]